MAALYHNAHAPGASNQNNLDIDNNTFYPVADVSKAKHKVVGEMSKTSESPNEHKRESSENQGAWNYNHMLGANITAAKLGPPSFGK